MDSSMILPVIATSSVIILMFGKLYYIIRKRFPVTVNCWFCSTNTSVPYNGSNSWYCPQCDQYNGFCSDGSYNRLLPEQYNERLNCHSWCVHSKQRTSVTNGLCRFCNINLELKIHQLAQFIPLNKENFDEEVQQYSNQLERVYRLCSKCQYVLNKTLREKQELFVTNQYKSMTSSFDYSKSKNIEKRKRHSIYLGMITAISLGLLISIIPHYWVTYLQTNYPLPDNVVEMLSITLQYFPEGAWTMLLLLLGVLVQLLDCAYMRDTTSVVNLLLWIVLLSLTQIPDQVEGLVSVIHMLASIVFVTTTLMECRGSSTKSIATIKPVQLHKLDQNTGPMKRDSNLPGAETPSNSPISPNSTVSDPSPKQPVPIPSRDPTPEDFGFANLNMSSKRLTRSQTKHFQTKTYKSSPQTDLFRAKSVNLSPPKLQLDKGYSNLSEYQVPLTRSSSQSSGFVSLSHQKVFEDDHSPSVIANDIDSASQCGRGVLTSYSSPYIPPPYSHPYGMPFSNFPYTIVHFTPPHFNKFYQHSNLSSYEPSLNMSLLDMSQLSVQKEGWLQRLKSAISSLLFLFIITTNVALLWKVFGEDYFKSQT